MSLIAENISLKRGKREVIKNLSLSAPSGQLTCLIGPNGAGKSSTLGVLSGELTPCEGCVLLGGRNLHDLDAKAQARQRAVMGQSFEVTFDFQVAEILEMGWLPDRPGGRAALNDALQSIVEDCDLAAFVDRPIKTLSGGERQRVHFARALLQIWPSLAEQENQPRYLLLDEPGASLDIAHELQIMRLARAAARTGVGVFLVLHDLNMAARFADHIVLLDDGRVAGAGNPIEVLDSALLSRVFGVPLRVERHGASGRLMVMT